MAARDQRLLLARAAATIREHLAALPKCDECGKTATRSFKRGGGRWCDDHGQRQWKDNPITYRGGALDKVPGNLATLEVAPEYQCAKTVRELQALLEELETK